MCVFWRIPLWTWAWSLDLYPELKSEFCKDFFAPIHLRHCDDKLQMTVTVILAVASLLHNLSRPHFKKAFYKNTCVQCTPNILKPKQTQEIRLEIGKIIFIQWWVKNHHLWIALFVFSPLSTLHYKCHRIVKSPISSVDLFSLQNLYANSSKAKK